MNPKTGKILIYVGVMNIILGVVVQFIGHTNGLNIPGLACMTVGASCCTIYYAKKRNIK